MEIAPICLYPFKLFGVFHNCKAEREREQINDVDEETGQVEDQKKKELYPLQLNEKHQAVFNWWL